IARKIKLNEKPVSLFFTIRNALYRVQSRTSHPNEPSIDSVLLQVAGTSRFGFPGREGPYEVGQVKRFSTAAMMLAVSFFSGGVPFRKHGIGLPQRGFSSIEALTALGISLSISLNSAFAVIARFRLWRRRALRDRRRRSEPLGLAVRD